MTVVEGQNRVLPLPSVDEEISRLLQREMKKKGIAVDLARTVTATTPTGTGVSVEIGASPFVEVANPPAPRTLEADAVCVTVGRVPHTDGLGLDAAGVKVDARGWIEADDFLETSVPGVYAIGDVIGPRRIMLAVSYTHLDVYKRQIPIIAMSADAFEDDVEKSLEAGMNAHISKPVDIPALFTTLRQIKDKRA